MPINLLKRGEKTGPITAAEHDTNLTTIEGAVVTLESADTNLQGQITALNTTVGTKLGNLSEDTDPALGGNLNGQNKEAHNVRVKIVDKSASFTVDPTEAAGYNIQGVANITVTLPSSLTTCPRGTGFEFHIESNIQVSFVTTSGNANHVVNANSHRKLIGPEGTGFARVCRIDGANGVWKLNGNTAV